MAGETPVSAPNASDLGDLPPLARHSRPKARNLALIGVLAGDPFVGRPDTRPMQRRWLVLIAVSLMFFFISSTTFMSLGVLLFAMSRDLHWTQTQAGGGFTVLGLACCLSSLVPMALVSRIGSRWTMLLGGLMLAAGFFLAFLTHGLMLFLLAMALLGVGFSLSANIPGVYLLARWFPARSGRVIGVYLMFGAFGGVAGPPLAQAVMASAGWRVWWLTLALAAAAMGLMCLLLIRDGDAAPADAGDAGGPAADPLDWRYREAVLTPQFVILAAGMVITEACVTVVHSAAVIHFSRLGISPAFAAAMLGLQAFMATAAKGLSGALGERVSLRLLLAAGLVVQALGVMLLARANSPILAYAFAFAFGAGWGTAYLTITVLLITYFGARTGSAVLSLVWLLTAFASLGPAGAGMIADRFGSYGPAFDIGGVLLLPIAAATLLMRPPQRKAEALAPSLAEPLVADPL